MGAPSSRDKPCPSGALREAAAGWAAELARGPELSVSRVATETDAARDLGQLPCSPCLPAGGSVPFPAAPGALGAARGQDPRRPGRSVTCGAGSAGREASGAIWVPRAAALPGGRGGAGRGTAGGALAARGRVSIVHPEERSEAREFEEPAAPPAAVLGRDCCAHRSSFPHAAYQTLCIHHLCSLQQPSKVVVTQFCK